MFFKQTDAKTDGRDADKAWHEPVKNVHQEIDLVSGREAPALEQRPHELDQQQQGYQGRQYSQYAVQGAQTAIIARFEQFDQRRDAQKGYQFIIKKFSDHDDKVKIINNIHTLLISNFRLVVHLLIIFDSNASW